MLVILIKIVLILSLVALGPVLIVSAVMAGRFKKKSKVDDPFSEYRKMMLEENVCGMTDEVPSSYNAQNVYESPLPKEHYQVDYKCNEVVKKKKKKSKKTPVKYVVVAPPSKPDLDQIMGLLNDSSKKKKKSKKK